VEYVLWLILTVAGGEQRMLEIHSFEDAKECDIEMGEMNFRWYESYPDDSTLHFTCLERTTT
jgi:hypothetical protein